MQATPRVRPAALAPAATAFAHRGRRYDFLILTQWDDPSDSPGNMRWTRELFDAMSPHFRGVYVNNLGDEGSDRVRDAYGINYNRLAGIKAAYDPDNVFRLNQNIRPAGWRGSVMVSTSPRSGPGSPPIGAANRRVRADRPASRSRSLAT